VKLDGSAPRRRGFGTELLERTLSYELDAKSEIQLQRDGISCVISVPLTDRIIVTKEQ
jgi:two-component system, chemotaxis family, CheB/CheR fusion protein